MQTAVSRNPLVRVLAAIGALVLAGIALVLGAMVFLTFLGLAVIAALLVWVRLWWIRRQLRRQARQGRGPGPRRKGRTQGRVIEGEYRRDE